MSVKLALHNQAGFSLLEVLISVVVLAVGLLGIAAMQLNMIRYNHSAHMRSIAIAQANNMIDSMRANYAGIKSGQYNSISGIPAEPTCTTCSATETAQRDAHIWNTYNSELLPSGQGTVASNGNTFTITVRWDNNRTGATGMGCSGNDQVDLACHIVEVEL